MSKSDGIFSDAAYLNGVAQEERILKLSDDQEAAVQAVIDFLKGPGQHFVIGGVAGSGKSSIIPHIVSECFKMGMSPAVCAPTGKAAMVLRRKGITGAVTLHSFLYRVETLVDKNGKPYIEFVPKPRHDFYGVGLLIIDEASMINKEMYDYIGELPFKTLYIGDHFQLPPVNDNFNIMVAPNIRLEKILRQNEGNPIVMLAEMARNGQPLPLGQFGDSKHTKVFNEDAILNYDEIIVWTNKCKDAMNDLARMKRGLPMGLPQIDDKMIVRVNCKSHNVFNGQIVYLCSRTPKHLKNGLWSLSFIDELAHDDVFVGACTSVTDATATIHLPKEELDKVRLSYNKNDRKKSVAVHLDWGYAITCHSAQGSSWKNIAVIDENRMHWMQDYNRWMYTAITRAEESVVIYSGDFSKYTGK